MEGGKRGLDDHAAATLNGDHAAAPLNGDHAAAPLNKSVNRCIPIIHINLIIIFHEIAKLMLLLCCEDGKVLENKEDVCEFALEIAHD